MIDIAERYVGVPYRHLGRSIDEGLDCYGLVRCFYRDWLGVDLPDTGYAPDWYKSKDIITDHYKDFGFVAVDDERDGDLVVISMKRKMIHLTIAVAGRLLHAVNNGFVVFETYSEPYRKRTSLRLRYVT